jgi:hypothetical protein
VVGAHRCVDVYTPGRFRRGVLLVAAAACSLKSSRGQVERTGRGKDARAVGRCPDCHHCRCGSHRGRVCSSAKAVVISLASRLFAASLHCDHVRQPSGSDACQRQGCLASGRSRARTDHRRSGQLPLKAYGGGQSCSGGGEAGKTFGGGAAKGDLGACSTSADDEYVERSHGRGGLRACHRGLFRYLYRSGPDSNRSWVRT